VDAGFPGLAFHVHDFPNGRLVGGIERGPRMHGYVLARKGRQRDKESQQ